MWWHIWSWARSGDWNVVCNNESARSVFPDDFGGASEWLHWTAQVSAGGEVEGLFAGSTGRATFIAEDTRRRSRAWILQIRRKAVKGGRGRREKGCTCNCRLFIADYPEDAEEDEVRDMFKKHGKVKDFALMRTWWKPTWLRVITFESKDMAERNRCAKRSENQRPQNRSRDADAPRDEKPKRAPRPQGARLTSVIFRSRLQRMTCQPCSKTTVILFTSMGNRAIWPQEGVPSLPSSSNQGAKKSLANWTAATYGTRHQGRCLKTSEPWQ